MVYYFKMQLQRGVAVNTFDLIMLVIIIVFAIIGYARGAVKTILSVIGGIVSYFAAVSLSNRFAQPIYELFFKESVVKEISTRVGKIIEENNGDIGDSMLQALPDSLQMFVSDTNLVDALNSVTGETNEQVIESATQIIQAIIDPLAISLLSVCIIFILFIVFNIIVSSVLLLINFINNIPIIGKANRITGAVIGLVAGVVLTHAAVTIGSQIIPYVSTDSEFSEYINSNSVFFEIFADEKNDSQLYEKYQATELATEGE